MTCLRPTIRRRRRHRWRVWRADDELADGPQRCIGPHCVDRLPLLPLLLVLPHRRFRMGVPAEQCSSEPIIPLFMIQLY
jgi:hypothetical protein